MTANAVGLVLVEGHEADGEIMDQDAFDVPTRRGATAISSSDYVAGALSRTHAMAGGRRPSAIGVTWSDDSELQASLFLKTLTDAGYQNVVAVRSPEAGEALARGIGKAVGYEQTAVCLLEPDTIVMSVVDTDDGAVQTVAYPESDIRGGITRFLSEVFDRNAWNPECLIVVGPDADEFTIRLELALGIPVFAPAEAEFALARGAALASAHGPESSRGVSGGASPRPRPRSLAHTAALTMLVGGSAIFVAAVCLAAGLRLTSSSTHTTPSPTTPSTAPTAMSQTVPAAPAPALDTVAPRTVEAIPDEPAPADAQEVADTPPQESPAPDQLTGDGAPAPDAVPPAAVEPAPPDPAAPPADDNKPPLLTRVLEHVPGLQPDAVPPANQSPAPPDGAAPPSP